MIEVLSKPAEQITAGDIQALIDSEVPEGEQIEFKETLPSNDKNGDPWIRGEGSIGVKARNELLEEVAAFANAHGGALLLGVKESKARPPVAAEITPIPRCAELAERLKLVFRDCVEPQIPRIEIFVVKINDDNGVVVLRIGRSRMAPHRVTTTLKCPVRRADRCEGMSMREIQDMTLNVSRGLELVERRLAERSDRFPREFDRLQTPEYAFGCRMTAVPVGGEIHFDRVFRRNGPVEGLVEPWHRVSRQVGEQRSTLDTFADVPNYWRPLLRAARADSQYTPHNTQHGYNSYLEIHCDGLIELGFVLDSQVFPSRARVLVPPNLLFVVFANLTVQAQRVRGQTSAPMSEYAIEVETYVRGHEARLWSRPGHFLPENLSSLGAIKFPRYPLGDSGEIARLLNLFYRDFWNNLGTDIGTESGELVIDDWPDGD